tara:strand:- start:344 stop:571 length:228 start_codon:yes stop_codon:yes gene_type:complete
MKNYKPVNHREVAKDISRIIIEGTEKVKGFLTLEDIRKSVKMATGVLQALRIETERKEKAALIRELESMYPTIIG